jgi:hypothetical protein
MMTTNDNFYVSNKVNDLVIERENWEQNEFLVSNKVLYGLLAKCMKLAAEISESRKLQTQVDEVLDAYKVRLTSGTPLITKVIKLVFGADRRRASAYSIAVRIAKQEGVKPDELSDWLLERGGIEEVRLESSSATGESAKERRARRQTLGERSADGNSPLVTIPKSAGTPEAVGPTLMLARVETDRTASVLCFVDNETLVKAALEYIGKQAEKEEQEASDPNRDAVDAALDAVEEQEQAAEENAA